MLGSSSSTPRPGCACSSYLFEAHGTAVVADLGNGALGNLHRYRNSEDVDAVVISHMHADHFIDVIAMRYTLRHGLRTNDRKIRLCLPPGGEAMLSTLVEAFAPEDGQAFLSVFAIETYDPTVPLRVGAGTMRFAPSEHYVPTFAMRYDCGERTIAYSSDTAPAPAVAKLARDADLFVCEATLRPHETTRAPRGHVSAAEAGEMARASGCGRLLLTHYPADLTADFLLDAARATFEGAISVVDDNSVFVA